MRIIGGKFGGRRINLKIPENVRPTSDKIKESMFNVLSNLIDFEGKHVLDLFAGTGALGFEALSRGAGYVQFIDKNRKSIELIKNSAYTLGAHKSSIKVRSADANTFLNTSESDDMMFDLVFADPPYDVDIYEKLLNSFVVSKILKNSFIAVVEFRSSNTLIIPEALSEITRKVSGDTGYIVLERN
ncbi:MAG: 16S rRNA (guanine(966)-N(2))-methyltransferase RsmD [Candidatus Kapaibacterium sp.]